MSIDIEDHANTDLSEELSSKLHDLPTEEDLGIEIDSMGYQAFLQVKVYAKKFGDMQEADRQDFIWSLVREHVENGLLTKISVIQTIATMVTVRIFHDTDMPECMMGVFRIAEVISYAEDDSETNHGYVNDEFDSPESAIEEVSKDLGVNKDYVEIVY